VSKVLTPRTIDVAGNGETAPEGNGR